MTLANLMTNSLHNVCLTKSRVTIDIQWIEGIVDDLDNNPFNGLVVYAKALKNQIIYFNKQEYFKLAWLRTQ